MGIWFDPGFRVIGEYILSQVDSILRVDLTLCWESIWLDIESPFDSILRVNLTRYWESIWLDIESQFDSILRVNLTQNILQLLGTPGRILVPPVTLLFMSKWLHFFFQCSAIYSHFFLIVLISVIDIKPIFVLRFTISKYFISFWRSTWITCQCRWTWYCYKDYYLKHSMPCWICINSFQKYVYALADAGFQMGWLHMWYPQWNNWNLKRKENCILNNARLLTLLSPAKYILSFAGLPSAKNWNTICLSPAKKTTGIEQNIYI